MAIAYFIPDQAQLLARSYQQNGQQAATSPRSSATPAATPPQPQQAQQQHRQQQQQQQHRPQFRANISVPLGSQQGSMSMSEFGCWDLLAQIFCYALRIYSYNSSHRRPTVIQISFEISSGSQDNEEDDVTDATSKEN
ncbi:cell death protein Grim [Drosophila ficusphila]|uniref:cell death protein Grim n=1 Tax=Drosophila ficusphila TaxID=30025 RepID=UPI0007E73C87|nr:cell death protein Grim [Drosophila ficusphila]